MAIKEIECCVAYCKACREEWQQKYPEKRSYLGCKLGYGSGERDISKARCKIKVCCFREKQLETSADCPDYPCEILDEFWGKKGWKCQQYKKQLEFIRQNGYEKFLAQADIWKGPHGTLKSK